MSSILETTLTGIRVSMIPHFLCYGKVERKKLVRILTEWSGVSLPVSIVSPIPVVSNSKLNLISSEIVTGIQSVLGAHL